MQCEDSAIRGRAEEDQNAVAIPTSRLGRDDLATVELWRRDLKKIKTELASLKSKRIKLTQKLNEQSEDQQRQQRLDAAYEDRRIEASLARGEM